MIVGSLTILFQTVLDGGYRKAIPNLVAWFERCIGLPSFIRRFGYIKMTEKAMKPVDPKVAAQPKLVKKESVLKPMASDLPKMSKVKSAPPSL